MPKPTAGPTRSSGWKKMPSEEKPGPSNTDDTPKLACKIVVPGAPVPPNIERTPTSPNAQPLSPTPPAPNKPKRDDTGTAISPRPTPSTKPSGRAKIDDDHV